MDKFKEKFAQVMFGVCACVSIIVVALICLFIFVKGVPVMFDIGIKEFITGTEWSPLKNLFGILPMIIGSIYVTVGAIIIGVPIGLLCAVFMARYSRKRFYKILKPAIELLAGIPSIVYGFFGLVVIVPIVRDTFGGSGKGILSASILLGIMILPTIISVSESAIRAVPNSYYEGALALGATKERSIFKALLPAAKSGIFAAVILGIGRAVGETMAVAMIAGNSPIIPTSITSGVRTLTSNIVLEMAYAEGTHEGALIATAVVLFIFILIINFCFSMLNKKKD